MPARQTRQHRTITLNGRLVSYELQRSVRHRNSITLRWDEQPGGRSLVVGAPQFTPLRHIEEVLHARASWITQHLSRPPLPHLRDQLRPGGSLTLFGRPHPVGAGGNPFAIKDGRIQVDTTHPDLAAKAEQHLRKLAKSEFQRRAEAWAKPVGAKPARIQIRDQRTRWGSASSNGTVSLNWRLIFAPAEILDYVVVHELCHFKAPDHSQHFWNLVEQAMPEAQTHRKWLKDHGESLRW